MQFSRRQDLQVRVFSNAAAYIGLPTGDPDFIHLTPESSRRFRALAAWFTLTAYGRRGHADIVRCDVDAARRVGAALAELPGVRLLAPVRLNVVCLAVPGDPARVARALADSGETFVTPTVYDGEPALRLAFSSWRTTVDDESRIVAAFRRALS